MTHAPDPVRRGIRVEVTRNACGPLYVYILLNKGGGGRDGGEDEKEATGMFRSPWYVKTFWSSRRVATMIRRRTNSTRGYSHSTKWPNRFDRGEIR